MLLVGIVALMWVMEAIDSIDAGRLDHGAGIIARDPDRLWAIFTSPFLHANFYPHLFDNTIPLLFMGVLIALRGAARLAAVTLIVIVIGGLGTWLISPAHTNTIGASGVVFGYATYLLARGLFNRSLLEIGVGLIVGVIWGGALISSVVPQAGVSWQAHVSGAVGGVIAAWVLSARSGIRAGRSRPGTGPRTGGGRREPAPLGGHTHADALDRALHS